MIIIGSLLNAALTAFSVGLLVANNTIALGVFEDAHKLHASIKPGLRFFPPNSWALICLFGSIPAFAVYWAVHYSTLAKQA